MSGPSIAILGIETSCDETAAAVVVDGTQVRSNVVASQHRVHERYGGVVPELASRAHVEQIVPVVRAALAEAGVSMRELSAIAVGHRPGLIGSLLVGVSAAKSLAWSLGLPLIGVDHVEAHLHAGLLDAPPARYPALGLVVSGGHTSLFAIDEPGRAREIGRTIDDAIGEAYDKVGVLLGLPYPGGPHVDALAARGRPDAFDFPASLPRRDSIDFSFSGLKTAVLYAVRPPPAHRTRRSAPAPTQQADPEAAPEAGSTTVPPLTPERAADIAASFQRAAVGVVMRKLRAALDRSSAITLLVGGGVSANGALRRELAALADERGLDLRLPQPSFCVDNAAMIAGAAHVRLLRGEVDGLELSASAQRGATRAVGPAPSPERARP